MKNVALRREELQNFKGIKELVVDFSHNTTISGRNASGKTTIFDAFTWCLFGKDSSGRSDSANGGFMVKTIDPTTGNAIPQIEHMVSVTLDIDGTAVVFTRQLVEEWGTTRGRAEVEFKGNTTHYFIDGVETKASEYAQAVGEVMQESLFRMITDPTYFPNLPWKEQREMLLTIAGDVTLENIAQGNATFEKVWNNISGKDLEDYKKTLANRRKDIEAELKLIPARISGIQMATPQAADYADVEKRLKAKQAELEQLEKEMLDIATAQRKQYERMQGRVAQIGEWKKRHGELLNAAKLKAQQDTFNANAKRTQATQQLEAKRKQLAYAEQQAKVLSDTAEGNIKRMQTEIERLQGERQQLLIKWEARNAEQYQPQPFNGTFTCPLCRDIECNHPVLIANHEETERAAQDAWYKQQAADLDSMTQQGQGINERIKTTTEQLKAEESRRDEQKAASAKEIAAIGDEIKQLQNLIAITPEVEETAVNGTDIPEWVELQAKIAAAENEPVTDNSGVDTGAMQQRKAALTADIDALKATMATKATIEANGEKIKAEEQRQLDLATQKADIEGEEMTIEEMVHKQSEEIERRVNSLFQLVKFRMFEQQINGGEKPTCIATVNGVRYADLNSAMKTNAGLDIINTICAFNEVTAPIFIDNAEGVNTLHPTAAQVVRLVVTNGDLTISNE